jgi:SH3-like domain-containing protein
VVGAASAVVALCFFVSWSARQLEAPIVVIDVPEAPVRAGVGTDAVVRFRAHAGTEAIVTDERDGWLRVALTDGNEGWLDARDVRRIP